MGLRGVNSPQNSEIEEVILRGVKTPQDEGGGRIGGGFQGLQSCTGYGGEEKVGFRCANPPEIMNRYFSDALQKRHCNWSQEHATYSTNRLDSSNDKGQI